MHLIPIQDFFHKNMHIIKKKEFFDRKVFKLQRFSKFFPMLVETPYFWGVINPKTYLNHDLGSKFFFLSSLAYKLVNLLVFEKNSCKMSKNWSFIKIIGCGLNFTYEFEVCSMCGPKSAWLPFMCRAKSAFLPFSHVKFLPVP